jgi:hypothetical protein
VKINPLALYDEGANAILIPTVRHAFDDPIKRTCACDTCFKPRTGMAPSSQMMLKFPRWLSVERGQLLPL